MNTVKDNQEFAIGAAIAFIGAVIYFIVLPGQLDLVMSDEEGVTPALFPKLASGAIIALGLIMSISALLNPNQKAAANCPPSTGRKRLGLQPP